MFMSKREMMTTSFGKRNFHFCLKGPKKLKKERVGKIRGRGRKDGEESTHNVYFSEWPSDCALVQL